MDAAVVKAPRPVDDRGELICAFELRGHVRGKGDPKMRLVHTRTGKHFPIAYKDSDTRRYEQNIAQAAALAMGNRAPRDIPIIVEVLAFYAVPASFPKSKREAALRGDIRPTVKPDANNISKCLDGCNGIVWCDDKQIVDERVRKYYGDMPGLHVSVWALKQMELI
jgi:Holliday junction resolvase RusA-like endonuclease